MKTYKQKLYEAGISVRKYYTYFRGKRSRKTYLRSLLINAGIEEIKPTKHQLFFFRMGRNPNNEELQQLAHCVDFEMWVCNYDTKHDFGE